MNLLPFRVSSSGQKMKHNKKSLGNVLRKLKLKPQVNQNLAKIALPYTMTIFHFYKTGKCVSPPLRETWNIPIKKREPDVALDELPPVEAGRSGARLLEGEGPSLPFV